MVCVWRIFDDKHSSSAQWVEVAFRIPRSATAIAIVTTIAMSKTAVSTYYILLVCILFVIVC